MAAGRAPDPATEAYLLYVGADRIARVVLARAPIQIVSPVDGVAEEVTASHIALRATGVGLRGPVGWGQPVVGRVILAVPSPDAELRAAAVDISAAGGILVAGARLDIEALTRARAIGVAGIICGGVVGRELQQLEESDRRQRAALHALDPVRDRGARRVSAGDPSRPLAWDLLAAAAAEDGRLGILPDARLAVVGGRPGDAAHLRAARRRRARRRRGAVPAGRAVWWARRTDPAARRRVPVRRVRRLRGDRRTRPRRAGSCALADLERLG